MPTFTALASAASVLLWAVGFVMGYMAYTRSMADLLAQSARFTERMSVVENSVTEVKGDVKWLREGFADIKLAIVPKR